MAAWVLGARAGSARGLRWQRFMWTDLLALLATAGFFALAAAFARSCERL